jgi:3-oxoadipate enol-lactonase
MPIVAVRDIKVYYELRGSGPRLLHISGTGADLRWPPTPFDTPLASRFEILAYDQRGLGQTSCPDVPYTMADYAADADALLETVGWNKCMVIGVSFGGMVAQELALRYPQRVERLVLACTSSGGPGGSSYPLHELAGLPDEERARKTIVLADTRRDKKWRAENTEEMQELVEEALAKRRLSADEPGRENGFRRQVEARAHHNSYDRLPELRLPVYLCGGRYDGIAPPANLRAMHNQIAGARLEFFEGGHPFLRQDPKAYDRIAAFLLGELD